MPPKPRRLKNKQLIFADYPEFTPNLTPSEIFKLGSFGGTYWRPIYSAVVNKKLKDQHLKYPKSWWKGIHESQLTTAWNKYNAKINNYGVKCGSMLEDWESAGWISEEHPYGWVQWYCDFYQGKRGPDDERQINRWIKTAGPKSRFRSALRNLINKRSAKYDDRSVSPRIRQTLQHWAYALTASDLKNNN